MTKPHWWARLRYKVYQSHWLKESKQPVGDWSIPRPEDRHNTSLLTCLWEKLTSCRFCFMILNPWALCWVYGWFHVTRSVTHTQSHDVLAFLFLVNWGRKFSWSLWGHFLEMIHLNRLNVCLLRLNLHISLPPSALCLNTFQKKINFSMTPPQSWLLLQRVWILWFQ